MYRRNVVRSRGLFWWHFADGTLQFFDSDVNILSLEFSDLFVKFPVLTVGFSLHSSCVLLVERIGFLLIGDLLFPVEVKNSVGGRPTRFPL